MAALKKSPVDYKKLEAVFSKRGLDLTKVAIEMGHTKNFLRHPRETGHLSNAALKTLELMYNIRYDDLKPDESESEQTTLEPVIESKPDIDYEALRAQIKYGIMDAEKNKDYNVIQEMLAYAFETAVRNILNDKAVQMQLSIFLTRCNSDGWRMAWRDKLEQDAEERRRAR